MTNHEFINRIRSLYNIDHCMLPELTAEQWPEFRDDPPRYLMHTDKVQSDAILREVEKRQKAIFVNSQVKFCLDMEEDNSFARLTVGPSSVTFPCSLAGDIADAFNQLWLDWHSADIIERESESEPQVDRPFYKDEIPF